MSALLYHWGGLNEKLFFAINSLALGPNYDKFMMAVTQVGDRHLFPHYMIALAFFVALRIAHFKYTGARIINPYVSFWVRVFAVLVSAFCINALAVHFAKDFFAFPRPFVALENVRTLGELPAPEKHFESFPSGHASFIMVMVVGLWAALWPVARIGAILLAFLVCWSRVAVGVHFPADVVYGAIIGGSITYVMARIVWSWKET